MTSSNAYLGHRSLASPAFVGGRLVFALASFLFLCGALQAQSSTPNRSEVTQSDNAIIDWNRAILDAIVATRTPPTVAARALAIVQTSAFNAWTAYTADAVTTENNLPHRRPEDERTTANKDLAISYACYRAIVDLFPSQTASLQTIAHEHHVDPEDASLQESTPQGIGNIAAAVVLAVRHHDGSNQLGNLHAGSYSDYTGYKPVNPPESIVNPDRWQPLSIRNSTGTLTVQLFVTPQWGRVTSFAGPYRDPEGPVRDSINHKAFLDQAKDLIRLSAELDDEQKVSAEYWALGSGTVTPPGRWFEFAQFVSKRDHHTVDDDAPMFFVLANAMLDASIECWRAKRHFDSERPITAIHYLFNGRMIEAWAGPGLGTRLIGGSEWQPYQLATTITPAFPEHVSGHSTFSVAAAEVLTMWTGHSTFGKSYTAAPGSSLIEPGLTPAESTTLMWPTFHAAADQAALSRRYGGIHFANGDLEGRELGRAIAHQVWDKARQYLGSSMRSDAERDQQ